MPTTNKATKKATKKVPPGGGRRKAAAKGKAPAFPEVTSETRIIRGIRLPWQGVEHSGPQTLPDGRVFGEDRPPKGTVVESGEVFIPLSTLEELAEQDVWDSQFGSSFLLGYHEGLALEADGLAAQETRGGYHRTDRLVAFLDHLAEQA